MSSNVPFSEFLDQYGQFNSAIRSHVAIADARPEVRAALTETTRVAFLEIIRRANIQNPQQPIWVRVDRTAERLGISTKSVSRTIKMMKKKGWLVPSKTHDGRNSHGEFDGREYLLTPAMRRLMSLADTGNESSSAQDSSGQDGGIVAPPFAPERQVPFDASTQQLPAQQVISPALAAAASLPPGSNLSKALAIIQRRAITEQSKKATGEAVSPQVTATETVENSVDNAVLLYESEPQNAERTDLSHGVIYEVNKVFSLKEASLHKRGHFLNSETGKTIRLPIDLVPLVDELGIKPEGVCKLMRIAGLKGHRLQDVWAVKREQFLSSGAREGRAVRYFEFLLNCGEDFAYRASIKVTPSNPKGESSDHQPTATSSAQTRVSSVGPAVRTEQAPNTALTKLLAIAKATRFKRFRHISNGMVVRFYDGVAEVTRGLERAVLAGWQNLEGFYVGISKGNLVPVTE